MLAAVGAAAFLVPYKAAARLGDREGVVVAMLISAAVLNTLVMVPQLRTAKGATSRRAEWAVAAALAVFTALGNAAVAEGLATLDAGVVSVLQQTQILFVAVLAWPLLNERITLRFALGALLAVVGFGVMRWPQEQMPAVNLVGATWVLVSALSFGLMIVITRQHIHRIRPVWVNATRLWLGAAVLLMLPRRAAAVLELEGRAWVLCAAAAACGPFFARLCIMYAVRWLSASHSTLLTLISPVFAFGLGFVVFGTVPATVEVIGGAIILAGVALPVFELMQRAPVRAP